MPPRSEFKARLRRFAEDPIVFVRWLVFAAIIGLVAGAVSTAFYYAFHWATETRTAHPWLLWLLPIGGIAIVLLYRVCGMEKDGGTNLVLTNVRENSSLPLRTAPLVFVSSIITHLVGALPAARVPFSKSAVPSRPPLGGSCIWMKRTAVLSPCAACRPPLPPCSAPP